MNAQPTIVLIEGEYLPSDLPGLLVRLGASVKMTWSGGLGETLHHLSADLIVCADPSHMPLLKRTIGEIGSELPLLLIADWDLKRANRTMASGLVDDIIPDSLPTEVIARRLHTLGARHARGVPLYSTAPPALFDVSWRPPPGPAPPPDRTSPERENSDALSSNPFGESSVSQHSGVRPSPIPELIPPRTPAPWAETSPSFPSRSWPPQAPQPAPQGRPAVARLVPDRASNSPSSLPPPLPAPRTSVPPPSPKRSASATRRRSMPPGAIPPDTSVPATTLPATTLPATTLPATTPPGSTGTTPPGTFLPGDACPPSIPRPGRVPQIVTPSSPSLPPRSSRQARADDGSQLISPRGRASQPPHPQSSSPPPWGSAPETSSVVSHPSRPPPPPRRSAAPADRGTSLSRPPPLPRRSHPPQGSVHPPVTPSTRPSARPSTRPLQTGNADHAENGRPNAWPSSVLQTVHASGGGPAHQAGGAYGNSGGAYDAGSEAGGGAFGGVRPPPFVARTGRGDAVVPQATKGFGSGLTQRAEISRPVVTPSRVRSTGPVPPSGHQAPGLPRIAPAWDNRVARPTSSYPGPFSASMAPAYRPPAPHRARTRRSSLSLAAMALGGGAALGAGFFAARALEQGTLSVQSLNILPQVVDFAAARGFALGSPEELPPFLRMPPEGPSPEGLDRPTQSSHASALPTLSRTNSAAENAPDQEAKPAAPPGAPETSRLVEGPSASAPSSSPAPSNGPTGVATEALPALSLADLKSSEARPDSGLTAEEEIELFQMVDTQEPDCVTVLGDWQPELPLIEAERPERALRHKRLAQRHLMTGREGPARSELCKSMQLDPGGPGGEMLASLYLSQRSLTNAESVIRAVLNVNPTSESAQELLGDILNQKGQLGKARKLWTEMLGVDPTEKGVLVDVSRRWVAYAITALKARDIPRAERLLRRALTFDPMNPSAAYLMSKVLDRQGASSQSQAWSKRAREIS